MCPAEAQPPRRPRRATELQFYTSAAAVAMLVPAWVFFLVSAGRALRGLRLWGGLGVTSTAADPWLWEFSEIFV